MSVIKAYDLHKYNFCKEVETIFGVEDLSKIHNERSDLLPADELNFDNETRTDFHSTFYGVLNSPEGTAIKNVYQNFINEVVAPMFRRRFVYQAFPSFRVHIPNDQAVHKWHYDSDENHNHPDWEINFQLALTEMRDSNAMWIESVPGLRDFRPLEMTPGEFAIFYGNKCAHGNKKNMTGSTRVSMDFRVIPYEKYDESKAKNSATANTKFVIGEYYKIYNEEE